MHVRHESLFRWLVERFPRTRLYGPYNHGGRAYFQWMARGPALVGDVLPVLESAPVAYLDAPAAERLATMLANYGVTSSGSVPVRRTNRSSSEPSSRGRGLDELVERYSLPRGEARLRVFADLLAARARRRPRSGTRRGFCSTTSPIRSLRSSYPSSDPHRRSSTSGPARAYRACRWRSDSRTLRWRSSRAVGASATLSRRPSWRANWRMPASSVSASKRGPRVSGAPMS